MASTVLIFGAAAAHAEGGSLATHRASRMLAVLLCLGVTVLWPMFRLSQNRFLWAGTVWSVPADLAVLLIPAQLVLVPQSFTILADWPWSSVVLVNLWLLGWGLQIGGTLVVAEQLRERVGPLVARLAGIAMAITIGIGGLVAAQLTGAFDPGVSPDLTPAPRQGWLATPITGVLEITRLRTWSGAAHAATAEHWRAALWTVLAGAIGLAIVTTIAVARRSRIG